MRIATIPNVSVASQTAINVRSILRIGMPLTVLLYCAGLNYAYVYWISPTWSYQGFIYRSPDMVLVFLGYLQAIILCLISPLRIRRPSQVIYWVLFFLVYIPGILIPLWLQLDSGFTLLLLQLSLTAGMLPIALSYKIPLLKFRRYPLNSGLFWTMFCVFYVLANALLLFVFRGQLHLASIKDVYAVRAQAKSTLDDKLAIAYLRQLLSNVMNPLLLAFGLVRRSWMFIALSWLGQIAIYATAAQKSVFIAPLVGIVFYFTIKMDKGGWVPKIGLGFAGILFSLTTLVIGAKPGAIFNIASVVLARTFAAEGLFIGEYNYFFETRPFTYLSNVNGIGLFITDPYTLPVGMEMSAYYGIAPTENGMVNENANFFATDGIGGFGLPGIVLMGFLCAGVFWVLDSSARRYPLEFSTSVLTMIIISLTNVSLFTTLLSNGLVAWILIFGIMPKSFMGAKSNE